MDGMIDGKALQNPGSDCLESNLNPLFPGDKQLGTYQGAFDGCHCAAGRGFWTLRCWQIAKHCQLFCEFLYHLTFGHKVKPIRIRKMNYVKEWDILRGAAIGSASSSTMPWKFPTLALFLCHLQCVDMVLRLAAFMVLRWLLHFGDPSAHMVTFFGIRGCLFLCVPFYKQGTFPVMPLAGFSAGSLWLIATTLSFLYQTMAHGMGLI